MKIRILCLALASLASACATQKPPSLAELEASRVRNVAAATRAYEGRSTEDVRTAAFEVIKLVNPNDVRFDTRSDRILASHTWLINLILSGSSGQRWYEVAFSEGEAGALVTLGLDQEVEHGALIIPMKIPTFRQDIAVGSDEDFWYNATVFFERLDYMLGVRAQWPTCPEFEKAHGRAPMYFCGGLTGGFGVADVAPAGPIPGPARTTK